MKNLWTPWRMEHVLGKSERFEGCIFDFSKQVTQDKERLLLFRDDQVVVLLNRFPYTNGHLLAAPARHLPELSDLEAEEQGALMSMLSRCCEILRTTLQPHGINIGLNLGEVAGAGIPGHLHFHIVPRWDGDHNFMTVCADIRTIPQHIDTTFDILAPHFL